MERVLPEGSTPRRIELSEIFQGSKSLLISEPNLWEDRVQATDLYIPYRTMLFFTAGAAFAQTHDIGEVYSGFINSNHAKELDCSAAFLNSLNALSEDVGAVRFRIPFREMTKTEVVRLAKELDVPIGRTYSCQVYSDVPCGVCPNCVDRLNALEEARLVI